MHYLLYIPLYLFVYAGLYIWADYLYPKMRDERTVKNVAWALLVLFGIMRTYHHGTNYIGGM